MKEMKILKLMNAKTGDNENNKNVQESKGHSVRTGMEFMVLAVVAMALVTIVLMSGLEDWVGMGTNLVFLAMMAGLLYYANKNGLKKMLQIGAECQNIAMRLSQMKTGGITGKFLWDAVKRNMIKFNDEVVNAQWELYLSGHMQGDASEYLDGDDILEHCEKNYCDMVPGLLTALGILGTFLGLIMGIGSFSLDNPEALENALGGIVGGINVAFYTSVYGVALSILFNLISKNCQKNFREKLYELHTVLELCFKEEDIHDANLQLVEEAKHQQSELEQIRKLLEADMAKIIGEKIAETLEPVMGQINASLNRVIGDFREEQSASLQTVVESFVEQMKKALDSHIDELGKSVARLSDSQNQMSKDIRKLLQEIGTTASDTNTINQESRDILNKFEEYLGKINTMMNVANQTFQSVEEYSRKMYETSATQAQIVQNLGSHEQSLVDTHETMVEVYGQVLQTVEANTKIINMISEKEESMANSQQQLIESLNKYSQGTMDVFTEMKAVQLAASAQYQNSWKILEKMQEKSTVSKDDVVDLIKSQSELLAELQKYMLKEEKRHNNALVNRLQKLWAKISKSDKQ